MADRHRLKFGQLAGSYVIVRLAADATVPNWATGGEFTSVTRTEDELSIVCPSGNLPLGVHAPHSWQCLKLVGPFAFSETGILLSFIQPLAEAGIGILALSTYDTDYILIQDEFTESALETLRRAGHEFIGTL